MKRKWMALAAAGCLLLSSCELLPQEETFRTAPLISEFEKEEYVKAECTRGDITLKKTVTCVYMPVRSEGLGYSVGGIVYDDFFVEAGDNVKEGQLLAQLRIDGLEENIESARRQVESTKLQLIHAEQDRELALERQKILFGGGDAAALSEALEETDRQFDARRQSLEDALSLAELQLEACRQQLDERQIHATMDGTVTYVRRVKAGDVSSVGERVVTVADSTMSLFRAETEYWMMFEPGQVVTISSARKEYEATVTSEAELGLAETEKDPAGKAFVYFVLNEPTFDLEDNDRGTLELVLDKRESVLRVPSKSIAVINGETVVYYENEEGMKAFKKVETGLEAENMTEIISGLEAGELVIAE